MICEYLQQIEMKLNRGEIFNYFFAFIRMCLRVNILLNRINTSEDFVVYERYFDWFIQSIEKDSF